QEPIPPAARNLSFTLRPAPFHARLDILRLNSVLLPFTARRLLPFLLLSAGSRRKSYGRDPSHHQKRPADDLRVDRPTPSSQLPENQDSPQQSPKLVRIRQGNAAADPDILRRVLLKQVSNNPDKSTQHQPEQHIPCVVKLAHKRPESLIANRQSTHHSDFT